MVKELKLLANMRKLRYQRNTRPGSPGCVVFGGVSTTTPSSGAKFTGTNQDRAISVHVDARDLHHREDHGEGQGNGRRNGQARPDAGIVVASPMRKASLNRKEHGETHFLRALRFIIRIAQ